MKYITEGIFVGKITHNRDFKGVWIPKEIWLDNELSIQEKIMLVEIHSLDNVNGCFASNKYFGDFFGLSPQRISGIINKLIKSDIITADYEYEGKEIKRRILKMGRGYTEIFNRVYQKVDEGYTENAKDNNTVSNTINKEQATPDTKKPSFKRKETLDLEEYPNIRLTLKEIDGLFLWLGKRFGNFRGDADVVLMHLFEELDGWYSDHQKEMKSRCHYSNIQKWRNSKYYTPPTREDRPYYKNIASKHREAGRLPEQRVK